MFILSFKGRGYMHYKIVKAEQKYVQDSISIFYEEYNEACQSNHLVPRLENNDFIASQLAELLNCGLGFVALLDNKVVGYITGWPVNEFFGTNNGVYVPLFGHGAIKEGRRKINQALYSYASKVWVEKGLINHVITMFCADKECIDDWVLLGFGNRCNDSIRSTEPLTESNLCENYSILKANKAHLPHIADLCLDDMKHFRKAPTFMVNDDESVEDLMKDFDEWLSKDNRHLWIAYDEEKAIGYMRIQKHGESFISSHPDMMNITGAFVDENYRGKGVSKLLLDNTLSWLKENGYPLCGVDYESINVTGSNFWNKYFKPYTYSMVRYVDDRILK